MKVLISLSIFSAVLLCGCTKDTSSDSQTMAPNGGKPYDAKGGVSNNPNIPANVKGAIPGAK